MAEPHRTRRNGYPGYVEFDCVQCTALQPSFVCIDTYMLLMCCFVFSPGEDVVINWVNPTQSERHWRSTIIMAYHSSPHLAFQFINR